MQWAPDVTAPGITLMAMDIGADGKPQTWSNFYLLGFIHFGPQNCAAVTGLPNQVLPADLPKSQYVDMAIKDANDAKINCIYFVLQIKQESGFNPNAASPAGAVGIAQFMPATAHNLGINPSDPVAALKGAAQLMARYIKIYSGWGLSEIQANELALAAYNAGGGAAERCVVNQNLQLACLPLETQQYIRTIMGVKFV